MTISPTDIRILFTNYDIIAYFLNLASCSEHFISIKHRILATFNINKKINLSYCMSLNLCIKGTDENLLIYPKWVSKLFLTFASLGLVLL